MTRLFAFPAVVFLLLQAISAPAYAQAAKDGSKATSIAAGGVLFQRNCSFCHGKDTAGGESGPDLTRSILVTSDVNGDKISEVVRNGRMNGARKMPPFSFSQEEMESLAAFIHDQQAKAIAKKGDRRGVDVADLQTGNVAAGKAYFNGAGGCARCHSPTGDLAGVASRLQGLALEERMLYPKQLLSAQMKLASPDGDNPITVTLPSGEQVQGRVEYRDEFVIGLRDSNGIYRSWPADKVHFTIENRLQGHIDLLPKYTDQDIHNLMAYMQTLR
jgi:cytochrome c oxidase cbb3-type subunit III